MHRNLDRRVEALVRVTDDTARQQLRSMLDTELADDAEGFDLQPDGTWERRMSTPERPLRDSQRTILARTLDRGD